MAQSWTVSRLPSPRGTSPRCRLDALAIHWRYVASATYGAKLLCGDFVSKLPLMTDTLGRFQFWLFDRRYGRIPGNAISTIRFWLWRATGGEAR